MNDIAPVSLAPAALHVEQLRRMNLLMKAMRSLADAGFELTGFSAAPDDQHLRIYIEPPTDALIEGRRVWGVFKGTSRPRMWFALDGVIVEWSIAAWHVGPREL